MFVQSYSNEMDNCPNNIKDIGFFYDGKTFKSDEQPQVKGNRLKLEGDSMERYKNSLLNEFCLAKTVELQIMI